MSIRKGLVFLWSGLFADIPSGWHLCDGSVYEAENLPDLRDLFVIGAGGSYAPEATGGTSDHTHPFTSVGHQHLLGSGVDLSFAPPYHRLSSIVQLTGITDLGTITPPFYALAFVIKL